MGPSKIFSSCLQSYGRWQWKGGWGLTHPSQWSWAGLDCVLSSLLLTIFSSLLPLAILKLGVLGTMHSLWSCRSQSFQLALLAISTRGKWPIELLLSTEPPGHKWDPLVWVEHIYLSCCPLQGVPSRPNGSYSTLRILLVSYQALWITTGVWDWLSPERFKVDLQGPFLKLRYQGARASKFFSIGTGCEN